MLVRSAIVEVARQRRVGLHAIALRATVEHMYRYAERLAPNIVQREVQPTYREAIVECRRQHLVVQASRLERIATHQQWTEHVPDSGFYARHSICLAPTHQPTVGGQLDKQRLAQPVRQNRWSAWR